MVPRKKVVPGAISEDRLTPGQLSAAVGSVQLTAVVQSPASALTVMLAGVPEMVGSWSSTTITLKVAVVWLPETSVAV